ncbi:MAG: preprotein translocase subunit SecY [Chloroflexi bacterium]|nr:preprotein translocase subunit SecY [Chloroflexota bacterium]
MLTAVLEAFVQPDLRKKILFTFALLIIYRFMAHIPVPGVDTKQLENLFDQNQLLGFLDLFSGGALRQLSIAAMGVYPYITASIVIQLLVPIVPSLTALSREGESGRTKLNQYTHWLTIPFAALQGYGQLALLRSQGALSDFGFSGGSLLLTVAMIVSMTAGTAVAVWLGELITENGIGNGISIIIFGGIVATLPTYVGQGLIAKGNFTGLLSYLVIAVLMVFFIVIFHEAQRRIPVQYARSLFRGGRMYRQSGASHIPLRVNAAGMIPLIFAMSIMIFPGTIASYFQTAGNSAIAELATRVSGWFDPQRIIYWLGYFLLAVVFTFFYTMVIFQQQNLSENLQKNGGFVPGIRPGRPTAEYLNRVLIRITWAGALFLGLIAILPFIAQQITDVRTLQLQSTSVLIVVGVVLETMKQLEAQLLMRQYEGFIR